VTLSDRRTQGSWPVELAPYQLAAFPITQARYAQVTGQRPSTGRIHEVGGKRPNAWDLYDMLGDEWQWCWDLYDAEVYGTYRVLRGGGWFDEPWSCRASVRRRTHPSFQIDDVAFRIARSS
jgi:formylglycine-generating enzyme